MLKWMVETQASLKIQEYKYTSLHVNNNNFQNDNTIIASLSRQGDIGKTQKTSLVQEEPSRVTVLLGSSYGRKTKP